MRRKVLITGSRQATPAMLAKVEEVVLWVKRQGYVLLVGDAPGVHARADPLEVGERGRSPRGIGPSAVLL
jgi:hypothetical protein